MNQENKIKAIYLNIFFFHTLLFYILLYTPLTYVKSEHNASTLSIYTKLTKKKKLNNHLLALSHSFIGNAFSSNLSLVALTRSIKSKQTIPYFNK